jgi:hypothetical protein
VLKHWLNWRFKVLASKKKKTKAKVSSKTKKPVKKMVKKVVKKSTASKKKSKAPVKKSVQKKPAAKKNIKKAVKKPIKKALKKSIKVLSKPIKQTKVNAKPLKPLKKVDVPVVQKVKKCKKSLCKEQAVINGYCRYHYIAGWKVENIDKKVKKIKHLEKMVNEIRKRFPHEYMELIKADLVSDKVFRQVLKDMDLEEDINNFEISDDTQKIIESYSSLVDLEREE